MLFLGEYSMATMRSPNYPSDGLEDAIQMARRLWDKENRTVISPEVAAKALGYHSVNGTSRVKLSSLKKFGFLEDAASGGVKVSDLAMAVLHHQPDTEDYQTAIRDAAL